MPELDEGRHPLEFLLHKLEGISIEQVTVTVPAATTLKPGMVLGKLTATGKYVPYDNAGGDGSDIGAGILCYQQVNATGGGVDVTAAVVVCNAAVRFDDLEWAAGLVDADKTAAVADLKALFIFAR